MLANWLDSYMEFTRNTESATIFHAWVARSVLSAVLRKKISMALGRISIYPNIYVVLVSEPGIARKSQAITYGSGLLHHITDVRTSADAITKEALIQELTAAGMDDMQTDGTMLRSSNMTIMSKEFETFLGQKKENTKMIVLLTDLFDAQELPWKYQTKTGGVHEVPSVYLSLLGATTPESLASSLPVQAIGGGLTSRILFVWASKKARKVAKPVLDPKLLELKDALINDLHIISRMIGRYEMSPECDEMWEKWYMDYDEQDPKRLCKDTSFCGWYARKPLYILKLAIIHAASVSDDLNIEWPHVEKAIADIEEVEMTMAKVFSAIGRSEITQEVEILMTVMRNRKFLSETELLGILYRDMDSNKFNNVVETARRAGMIKREFKHDGSRGVYYRLTKFGERSS